MLTRRAFAAGAAALPALHLRPSFGATRGLRTLASAHGLVYGCAVAGYELKRADFKAALLRESGGLVAEYEMKRKAIEPAPGVYDFAPADALVGFAQDHGLKFRGHSLLWHRSNPGWLEQKVRETRDEKLITGYIEKVMRRYGKRIGSWDVVNEILAPEDGRPDHLRKSFWLETFGPSYIDMAFHAARAVAPRAQLVYNDWGCELGGGTYDRFRAATLEFLSGAKARGVPIDALGLQGHLRAFGARVDQAALRRFLDGVASMGFRILVTEHDVDDGTGLSSIAARDAAAADACASFLDVVTDNKSVDAVYTWGLSDRFAGPPGTRKLPLDTALRRKPMWRAMARAFS